MTQDTAHPSRFNGWRLAGWGALAAALTLPAVAMRFTSEVTWTASDFLFAAILLALLGGAVEGALRVMHGGPGRAGLLVAAGTGFVTLWANAAVGFIGDNQPINLAFYILVAGVAAAALLSRGNPRVLAPVCALAALAHPALGAVAEVTMPGHAVEWGPLAIFAAAWGLAAILLQRGVRR